MCVSSMNQRVDQHIFGPELAPFRVSLPQFADFEVKTSGIETLLSGRLAPGAGLVLQDLWLICVDNNKDDM